MLSLADSIAGGNIEISSAFVGTQPSSYPVNLIHLWTSGSNEAVLRINLKKSAKMGTEGFKERLRSAVGDNISGAVISFEPGDLVEQVINMGSLNPVELAIQGRNLDESRPIAEKLERKLKSIPYLRDVQIATPLDYPALKLDIDRVKAGQLSLTVEQIGKSTVAATSSSRFTQPVYWLDKNTGTAYQVQVEYPQYRMNSAEQVEMIPVGLQPGATTFLRDVASWEKTVMPGEYDRLNQQRYLTLTANIYNRDLNTVIKAVKKEIVSLGELPRGVRIMVRGQADLLSQTRGELELGLLVAVVVIFLLISASFQSFRLGLVILSILPVVFCGSLLALFVTGNTLNIQSYMGMIMAVGVAVANGILFITSAEDSRKKNDRQAYRNGAFSRLRPILMTSIAMIAGMIPMASGIGHVSDQVAPLGLAVIGGLFFSLINTVLFLPLIYHRMIGHKVYRNVSLDPDDPESRYYQNR
jgi:multidrug efflux pump subunit AcrB